MKITWIENKNDDWKLATVEENGATYEEVSINRKSKKGEVFPNFDGLMPGAEVEGVLWQSQAQKWYLFPPKPKLEKPNFMKKPTDFKKAQLEVQEVITKNVGKAQDNTSHSVRVSSTFRMASETAIAGENTTEENILQWRKWYWKHWDDPDTDALYPD